MDRDLLEAYLSEGLSLNQIGEIMGRPAGTVGYWVAKYGLVANGRESTRPAAGWRANSSSRSSRRARPCRRWRTSSGATLDRTPLAAEARSRGTVRGRGHASRRPRGRQRSAPAERTVEVAVRTTARRSSLSGTVDGRGASAVAWSGRTGVGGSSETGRGGRRPLPLCGYDRCLAALQFHHLDPATKSFALSGNGVTSRLPSCGRRRGSASCFARTATPRWRWAIRPSEPDPMSSPGWTRTTMT